MSNSLEIPHFQFNVKASDKGTPEKTATTLIYVKVERDLKPPRFESLPYRMVIPETTEVEKSILTLRGRDDDKMVSSDNLIQEKSCSFKRSFFKSGQIYCMGKTKIDSQLFTSNISDFCNDI